MITLEAAARAAVAAEGTDDAAIRYAIFARAYVTDRVATLTDEARTRLYSLIAGMNALAFGEATLEDLLTQLPKPAAWDAATMLQLLDTLLRDQMQAIAKGAPPRLTLIPGGIVDG